MFKETSKLAIQAQKLFLQSLPIGSKFNVVVFHTEFKKLFPESVNYNDANLKRAMEKIQGLGTRSEE